jgi:manganese/zinc/iron transport system permease protein
MNAPTPGHDPLPTLLELLRVLGFQAGYNTSIVLLGVSLLGIAAGVVGTFAMLRKRALMSDTLSHASLPGIATAFLAAVALGASGRSLWLLLGGAAASGIVGVLTVQFIVRNTRLPPDAAMGAVLSVFFGIGFVLLSYIQTLDTGDQGGVAKFIYGQTATMTALEATSIAVVALLAVVAAAALFKEFRLVCFDPEFADAQGWSVSLIDLLMMALVVAVTVIGLRAVGLILIIALVIIPPAAARFWTERLGTMTLIAALFGGLSGYLGAAASALLPRFPAGAVIVLVAGALFPSAFCSPRRVACSRRACASCGCASRSRASICSARSTRAWSGVRWRSMRRSTSRACAPCVPGRARGSCSSPASSPGAGSCG